MVILGNAELVLTEVASKCFLGRSSVERLNVLRREDK